MEAEGNPKVLMVGPSLHTTSGISAVIHHWRRAGLGERVQLQHLTTLEHNVPGRFAAKAAEGLKAWWRMARMRRSDVDLLHVHLSYGASFYRKLVIVALARLRRIPTLVHLHGSQFEVFYDRGPAFQRRLIRWLFESSAAVIVLSRSWRRFLARAAPGVRTEIIYNGADPALFAPAKEGHGIAIASMGRLGERKGTFDLIHAFARIAGEFPEARLVLAGDGELERARSLARELGIEDRVELPGWVSGEALWEAFNRADVYALPSYNEGLPGSMMEAMAAATPVISSPVGGIPEVLADGHNGYLVNPGDVDALAERLRALCADETMRRRMGAAAQRTIAERFSTPVMVERLTQLYREVLDRSGAPSPGSAGHAKQTGDY